MRFALALLFALSTLTGLAQVSVPWSPQQLPASLTTKEARLEYLAKHYWDNTNFSDADALVADSSSEQAFVDFAHLLPLLTPAQWHTSFSALLHYINGREALLTHYRHLALKYLFAPYSPFANEDAYLAFLRTLISANYATDYERNEATRLAEQAIGMPMLDMSIVTSQGDTTHLTAVVGQEALLWLFDPECETCHTMQQTLAERTDLPPIVALYTGDSPERYVAAIGNMPATWSIATPSSPLPLEHLYNTQTRPALYLIREGRIAWRGYHLPNTTAL